MHSTYYAEQVRKAPQAPGMATRAPPELSLIC